MYKTDIPEGFNMYPETSPNKTGESWYRVITSEGKIMSACWAFGGWYCFSGMVIGWRELTDEERKEMYIYK